MRVVLRMMGFEKIEDIAVIQYTIRVRFTPPLLPLVVNMLRSELILDGDPLGRSRYVADVDFDLTPETKDGMPVYQVRPS